MLIFGVPTPQAGMMYTTFKYNSSLEGSWSLSTVIDLFNNLMRDIKLFEWVDEAPDQIDEG